MRDFVRVRNCKTVKISEFLALFPDAKPLFDFFKNKILVEKETKDNIDYYWLTIETRFNRQYNIRVNETKNNKVYFGAWTTNRTVEPFETWHRGNDLCDGNLSKNTINSFIQDVVEDLFVDSPGEKDKTPKNRVITITEETGIEE